MSAEAERLALQLGRAVRTRVAGVGSGGWEMKMQRQCLGFDCWAESAFFVSIGSCAEASRMYYRS